MEVSRLNNNNQLVVVEKPLDTKVYGEITISDIKKSNILNANKDIILARCAEQRIKDLDGNYVGGKITEAINRTIFDSGFSVTDIDTIIKRVVADIFSDFSHLTVSEVDIAFRVGLRGEYGKFMGLSVLTFYNWLKQYCETTRNDNFSLLQSIKKEVVVGDEEKRLRRISWLRSHISNFEKRRSGESVSVYDMGRIFYRYCIKNNIVEFTEEDNQDLYIKAKSVVEETYSPDKALSATEAKEFRQIFSETESGKDLLEAKIESEVKRLAIIKIYDKLIAEGKNLADIIDRIEGVNN